MVSLCILADFGFVQKFICIGVYITVEVGFTIDPIFRNNSLITAVNLFCLQKR